MFNLYLCPRFARMRSGSLPSTRKTPSTTWPGSLRGWGSPMVWTASLSTCARRMRPPSLEWGRACSPAACRQALPMPVQRLRSARGVVQNWSSEPQPGERARESSSMDARATRVAATLSISISLPGAFRSPLRHTVATRFNGRESACARVSCFPSTLSPTPMRRGEGARI